MPNSHKTTRNNFSFATHGQYYPHIDGIRALAVLPVLFFHVLAPLCPGGFIGVDVFFVISGYLITRGILIDLKKDQFTIRNFYYRRIRRIMPAYLTLLAVVFLVGCSLYYYAPLINLGEAIFAGTLFSANIYFWKVGGDYFASNIHGNPLLHLWSLSVEEQFYLVVPLLCLLLWKTRHSLVAPVLAVIAGGSMAGAIYTVMFCGGQSSAFYLIHYRAWELLAGSLLAMIPEMKCEKNGAVPRKAGLRYSFFAVSGFLAVMMSYALFSSQTPFPGLAAVPPVVGTALLLRYGEYGPVSRLLTNPVFVFIGKISYSLYLWHWPVIVFWKYAVYEQLTIYDYVGMTLLSFGLAYISWRYVEVPARTSLLWTGRRCFALAVTGIALFALVGAACILGRGGVAIFRHQANSASGGVENSRPGYMESAVRCRIDPEFSKRLAFMGGSGTFLIGKQGPPEIYFIGDSHAGVLRPGFDILFKQYGISAKSTSFSARDDIRMYQLFESALQEIEATPSIVAVVIARYWLMPTSLPVSYERLADFIGRIRDAGKMVFIIEDVPFFSHSVCDVSARTKIIHPRKMRAGWNGLQSVSEYENMQGYNNKMLNAVCQATGAKCIPMHLALRQGENYSAIEEKNGQIVQLYMDEDHLSRAGSLKAAQFAAPYLFSEIRLLADRKKSQNADRTTLSD